MAPCGPCSFIGARVLIGECPRVSQSVGSPSAVARLAGRLIHPAPGPGDHGWDGTAAAGRPRLPLGFGGWAPLLGFNVISLRSL